MLDTSLRMHGEENRTLQEHAPSVLNARSDDAIQVLGSEREAALRFVGGLETQEDHMTNLTRITAVAVFAAAAWAGASSFTPAAAAPQEGLTQELSAACRTVVSTRWSNGRRVTTKRRVCTPSYGYGYRSYGYGASCRYVTQTRWSNGRRVTVRTRVC